MDYFVKWEVDIFDVKDELEAAQKALAMQRDRESTATVFDVSQKGREWFRIDLGTSLNPKPAPARLIDENQAGLNSEAASRADDVLTFHSSATNTTKNATTVHDVLADLMHWCDQNNADFYVQLAEALRHYREETGEKPKVPTPPPPLKDGWTRWGGWEPGPGTPNSMVEVETRDGMVARGKVKDFVWSDTGLVSDIYAYKFVQIAVQKKD